MQHFNKRCFDQEAQRYQTKTEPCHQTVDGDSEQSKVPPAVGRVNGPRVWAGTMSEQG